jgi:tol-pal system protein YbgF
MVRSAALAFFLAALATPTLAGPFDGWLRPPGDVGGVTQAQSDSTVADLVARVQRLEGQNRQLTGQVQELQNTLRRALDDFNKYREDTEFRLQSLEGGGKGPPPPRKQSEAQPPRQPQIASGGAGGNGAPPTRLGTLPSDAGGGDMMDGGGMADDGGPVLDDPNAPMQLPQYGGQPSADAPPTQRPPSSLTPPGLPGVAVDTSQPPQGASPQMASLPQTPEDEYTADYRLIEGKSYEAAELAFRKFVKANPSDKRVPDSIHWIGESLFQRQQYRDAAEQFLVVTTKYGSSRRAPSSMLRLGMSLAALGEKDAACATFQEIGRKYPTAGTAVKSGVDRETKKNSC